MSELLKILEKILLDAALAPALAGKLYGELMFLSSQYFGRLGRALLRAFSRRQHELDRYSLNPQIVAAVNFWLAHMRCLRPREIPVSLANAPATARGKVLARVLLFGALMGPLWAAT